ncbi:MAG: hypothetical protein IT427_15120 [Pirellulales bacterium]|nr:hypothetical protein [Pirellulales bacterium]
MTDNGKAKQPTFIDGDWESNGMFRWYIGPPEKLPKRSKADDQQHFAKLKTYLNQPWPARLAEWREWLTDMISPWWEGPLDDDFFFQEEKEGSLGWGHQRVKGGRWYWRRKLDCEIVIANASTGNGFYRMIDGAPTGGYIRDAISALSLIDLLETKLADGSNLDSIVRLAIEVGQDIEQVANQATYAPIVLVGRRVIVDRPKAMQKGRAKANKQKSCEKRKEAEQAIERAKHMFPTAAADNKISFLKSKAAESLGINLGTLNRRLRKEK